ncbi:MAG: hypothetical protein F8N39_03230 [Clostridiaceae bacterium]|nr:hypothetical protein [Clostridiaceae bacterium]
MDIVNYYCGSEITVLSPKLEDLTKYISEWDGYNKSHGISSSIRDWEESIEELNKKTYSTDPSISNRVSISFLFEFDSKKFLFLGDSNHSVISKKLRELGFSSPKPLEVDFVKLAHHGSKYNISNKLIQMINCNNFIISSNGRNLYKETLARILMNKNRDYTRKITFYFNYPKENYNNLFSEDDLLKYNFTCKYCESNKKQINIEL